MKKNKKLTKKTLEDLTIGGLKNGFGGIMTESREDYKNRKVGRYGEIKDDLVIDTCFTFDTGYFETGIIDKRYKKDGEWLIVEEYKTKKEAISGHEEWVKLLTGKKLPKEITDIHADIIYKLNK
jgi:hypothetical protein